MKDVRNFAKWFMDNNLDEPRNTLKGNTKLQKLLFFSQLISIAKYDKLLFDEQFSAFEHGMVIDEVRKEYCNNIHNLLNYQLEGFTNEELDVLNLTKNIYGLENSDSLSDMSHQFEYWKKYFDKSKSPNGYNKHDALVPNTELQNGINKIKDVLTAYNYINTNEYKNAEDIDY